MNGRVSRDFGGILRIFRVYQETAADIKKTRVDINKFWSISRKLGRISRKLKIYQ
jgi:hypothetical protein